MYNCDLTMPVFICRLKDNTVGFRESYSAGEILGRCPDVLEAYELTASQELEVEAAWAAYWEVSQDNEKRARELLAAVMRSLFQRAKEQEV